MIWPNKSFFGNELKDPFPKNAFSQKCVPNTPTKTTIQDCCYSMQRVTNTWNPTHLMWWLRLCSALRTTLACSILGCTTPYPENLQRLLAYPAFSYLTTILIMSDATLGDPKKFLACYLHYNSGNPLCTELLAIEPPRLTNSLAAVAVALKAFVVALPESTHLMSKRIEFGQIVIVYVQAVTHGAQTGIIKHLINVASSTALELWLLS